MNAGWKQRSVYDVLGYASQNPDAGNGFWQQSGVAHQAVELIAENGFETDANTMAFLVLMKKLEGSNAIKNVLVSAIFSNDSIGERDDNIGQCRLTFICRLWIYPQATRKTKVNLICQHFAVQAHCTRKEAISLAHPHCST